MSNNNVCQILVVDPDPDWVDSAVQALTGRGFRAQGVIDIDQVRWAPKFMPALQLVFVDLEFAERMPDQFQRFAERENTFVVVLFPTGLVPYRMSRIFKLGAYDCVGKPYDAQSLIGLAESLVKEICPPPQDAASSLASSCALAT